MSESSNGTQTSAEQGSISGAEVEHIERMAGVASLLSLDVTLPFYEAMGLHLADPGGFQQAIRQLIKTEARRYDEDKPFPNLLAAMRHDLTQREGETQAHAFQRWFDNLYWELPYQQLQWSLWLDAFHQGFDPAAEPDRQLLAGDQQEQAVAAFAEFMDVDELRQQSESVASQPLSDWDLESYVRRGFDPDDDMMDDPFCHVFALVEMARVQAFAHSLIPMLTAEEHEQLREQAAWLVAELAGDEPLEPLSALSAGLMGMRDEA